MLARVRRPAHSYADEQGADETEAWRKLVGIAITKIFCAKLQAEKVTIPSSYEYPKVCGTIEHTDDFVVDLTVCAEDRWTARLLVVSDRTAIGRSTVLAHEPEALYDIVGNKVFVD